MSTLSYRICPLDPAAHRFHVTLTLACTPGQELRLYLPSWIPGSYLVRDFARHLLAITARDDGGEIAIESVDRQSWCCTPTGDRLDVDCEFHARDASVRSAFLDDTRGFFNFTSLALRVEGMDGLPCAVTIEPPPMHSDWRLVTSLPACDIDDRGFGLFSADNYWDLIDHPVAMGTSIEEVAFAVRGVPHAFVLLGTHDADTHRLAADLAQICAAQAAVFDALPARSYLFLAHLGASGFGGLEHRESSVLQVARHALPAVAAASAERSEPYETLLGLCSHEYFHLWNVKRIRPQAVAESDLASEAYFRDLWAYEGVTSYYDDLALVRAGVISPQRYLDRLARLATRIDRTPGRHRQSLAQSSFDAWLKFYRPDENTPNAVVSYYGKGAQLALALDLKLRVETDGRVSLDDVMRRLWDDYGVHDTPVPDGRLARLAGDVSGLDLATFFKLHLETTADAPWADYLAQFGIRATAAPASDDAAVVLGRLGLRMNGPRGASVNHVLEGTPAQAGGLSSGDRLLALDGLEIDDNLAARLARYPGGASVRVHLFRGDELIVRDLTLGGEAALEWQLAIDHDADARTHARRARWLGHANDAP